MIDLQQLQKRVYENKLSKNFNTTDIYREFCYLHGELSEACEAYMQKKEDLGEELADVAIYLLGLSEILGINLEGEILNKISKNEQRRYIQKNGVNIRVSEEGTLFSDLAALSVSSTDFWDNEIDDEVWNNV